MLHAKNGHGYPVVVVGDQDQQCLLLLVTSASVVLVLASVATAQPQTGQLLDF